MPELNDSTRELLNKVLEDAEIYAKKQGRLLLHAAIVLDDGSLIVLTKGGEPHHDGEPCPPSGGAEEGDSRESPKPSATRAFAFCPDGRCRP